MSTETTDSTDGRIEHNYVQLGNREVSMDDIAYGVRYRGIVNGVTEYGAFVTLANMGEPENELVGLSHAKFLPPMYTPEDYTTGDVVGVMVTNQPSDGRVQLEIVSHIQTQNVPRGEFEPTAAKVGPQDQLMTYENKIQELASIEASGTGSPRETAELLRTVAQTLSQLPEETDFEVDITIAETETDAEGV